MKVTHYKDVELKKNPNAKNAGIRWLITDQDGDTGMAMRLIEIEPGGNTPKHSHSWEHQVFVIEGEGRVFVSGETRPFGPGSAVFVPPNEDHTFYNDTQETMRFVCMVPARAAKPREE